MRERWQDPAWDHCRGLTNRIIDINADFRYPKLGFMHPLKRAWRKAMVASRKRTETFGNPGSDHHVSQTNADAVDFRYWRTSVRYGRMEETMRRLGYTGPVSDFGHYMVWHNGKQFRIQPIAALHGTGPHLHFGVRRVA